MHIFQSNEYSKTKKLENVHKYENREVHESRVMIAEQRAQEFTSVG